MDELSEYELAQKRIEARQRKRSRFYLWLFILIFLLGLLWLGGFRVSCLWPVALITGLLMLLEGVELYFASPRRAPAAEDVNREMAWLFGNEWPDMATTHEFVFAQERIRKRRIGRVSFLLHTLLFLAVNGFIVYMSVYNATHFSLSRVDWLPLAVPMIWLFILARHAWSAFPTQTRLARRERKAGEALRLELQRMRPEKLKHEEKPKRDRRYTVGDDGELIELDDESEIFNEKPKRDINA